MSTKIPVRIKDEGDIFAKGSPERIEPGEYDAICYRTDKKKSWGGNYNFYLRFRILGGKYDGIDLFMSCTCPDKKLTHRHKYYEQWSLAMGRRPHRGEGLPRNRFKGKLYRIKVRDTIRRFEDGKPKPDFLQYSVVDTILYPQTGSPTETIIA